MRLSVTNPSMCILHQLKLSTTGNEPENVQKLRAICCKTQCHTCGRVMLRSCMLVKGVHLLLVIEPLFISYMFPGEAGRGRVSGAGWRSEADFPRSEKKNLRSEKNFPVIREIFRA